MPLEEELRKIKMVVTDVDDTLTYNWILSCKAVEAVRKLESVGIKVTLVTSNSAAFIATFAKYLGISGYVIAEGGAVILDTNFNILCIVKPPEFDRDKIIKVMEKLGFKSIFNEVKFVDLGFFRTEKSRSITIDEIRKELEKAGIKDVEIYDSKYAVHVLPKGANKANAILKVLEFAGLSVDDIIVIGDGDNDIPMFKIAKLTAAPANATEGLRKYAKIIASKPNGEGFAEIAEMIIKAKETK